MQATRPAAATQSAAAAKARLIDWARETDAARARERPLIGKLAASGMAALALGMVASRVAGMWQRQARETGRGKSASKVGKGLLSVALVVRLAKWLLPLLLKRLMK